MPPRPKKKKAAPEIERTQPTKVRKNRPAKSAPVPWLQALRAALIAALGLWIFWPALGGDWIGDDRLYITGNPLLHDPARLWKAWFVPGSFVEYYPIEQTVQWIQWQLWREDKLGYHLTNVVLHITSALLVWRLLARFGLRFAWLGGLIFVAHPMVVDSVALINELKASLSLPAFLLAMLFWIDYEERNRWRDYACALGFFVVAMFCKITMTPFPIVLLLFAWWKRGRLDWRDLAASAPFFLISLVLGLTSLYAGSHYTQGHPQVHPSESLLWRAALAGQTIAFYFSRSIFPIAPAPVYFQWTVDPSGPLQFLPWVIFAVAFFCLWRARKSWGRHALLGLGFFVIMLAPFVGLVWISYMKYTWILEHLLYIPIIGIIGLVVAAMEQIDAQSPRTMRPFEVAAVVIAIALLALQSHVYAGMYQSEETLARYVIAKDPSSALAHNMLGAYLMQEGRTAEAQEHFEQVLALQPNDPDAYFNVGNGLLQTGRVPEAIVNFEQALRINSNPESNLNADITHYLLGNALAQAGRVPEAIAQFEQALTIKPDYAEAANNLGALQMQTGHLPEAIGQFRAAIKLKPDYAQAYRNLGQALAQSGHAPEAIEAFTQAIQLKPDDAEARYDLGNALMDAGRGPEAIAQFEQALKTNADHAETHYAYGNALMQAGRGPEALAQFQQAVKLKPDYAEAYNNLGIALAQSGHVALAREEFAAALRINPNYTDAQNNLALTNAKSHNGAR